jgi:hypothetical protein
MAPAAPVLPPAMASSHAAPDSQRTSITSPPAAAREKAARTPYDNRGLTDTPYTVGATRFCGPRACRERSPAPQGDESGIPATSAATTCLPEPL